MATILLWKNAIEYVQAHITTNALITVRSLDLDVFIL